MSSKFHHFSNSVVDISLPQKFTYPFYYTPHLLCTLATEKVQEYLHAQFSWKDELNQGKMFGVLIVQNTIGEIGFLAAFSGILAGNNAHSYFVPPVYDLQQQEGFFQAEEREISAINTDIKALENEQEYLSCQQELQTKQAIAKQTLEKAKEQLKADKAIRTQQRNSYLSTCDQAALIKESQHQKAEFKRLKQNWENQMATIEAKLEIFQCKINALKTERKQRSALLQQKLFEHFCFLNAKGESKNLCEIFEQTAKQIPPAGSGECAAPKLLQYAYQNKLTPMAMAEFWWGESPQTEIRHHGYYYPSCREKCEPILNYMLQGLEVEENPLEHSTNNTHKLEILFEDEYLVAINKPSGMLSVPGKSNQISVYQLVRMTYPAATGPMIVHRLDMATSGILLITKTKEVHKQLQIQFKNHTIKKRYIAILDGVLSSDSGRISLPLCPNPNDRPRQMVSYECGKNAITEYEVIEQISAGTHKRTRIAFNLLTGRTHQLRVHSAHPKGLNTPILGDELYGQKSDRLYLHAEMLEFQHPISKQIIQIEKRGEF